MNTSKNITLSEAGLEFDGDVAIPGSAMAADYSVSRHGADLTTVTVTLTTTGTVRVFPYRISSSDAT